MLFERTTSNKLINIYLLILLADVLKTDYCDLILI